MSFENLGLHEALTRAVADAGYDSAALRRAAAAVGPLLRAALSRRP